LSPCFYHCALCLELVLSVFVLARYTSAPSGSRSAPNVPSESLLEGPRKAAAVLDICLLPWTIEELLRAKRPPRQRVIGGFPTPRGSQAALRGRRGVARSRRRGELSYARISSDDRWRPPTESADGCKPDPVKPARTACGPPSPIGRSLRYTASWVHCLLCSQHSVFTGKGSSQVAVFTVVCEHSVTCSQGHSFTVLVMLAGCVAVNRGVGEEMGR
jgi:hypothetical protein